MVTTANEPKDRIARNSPLSLNDVVALYPGVFTVRLLRTLVATRQVTFTRAGRRLVFYPEDLQRYLDSKRVERVVR